MIKRRIKYTLIYLTLLAAVIATTLFGEGWYTNIFKLFTWFLVLVDCVILHEVLEKSEDFLKPFVPEQNILTTKFLWLVYSPIILMLAAMDWFWWGGAWVFIIVVMDFSRHEAKRLLAGEIVSD